MKLDDFDYDLPAGAIAQEPLAERDAARLLVHAIDDERTQHAHVRDLPELLRAGDLLVVNDTRVLPARIEARRSSGGRVKLLFLEPIDAQRPNGAWSVFANPARKLRPGETLTVVGDQDDVQARLLERPLEPDGRPGRRWTVVLSRTGDLQQTQELLIACGRMPLPPYIERTAESRRATPAETGGARTESDTPAGEREAVRAVEDALDRERYQTVYARPDAMGAVAAPTAGLHFTPELFERLEARGIRRTSVTLHVGAGTFAPVTVENVEDHVMHDERYELGGEAVEAIARTKRDGGRVVCVGTTSVRVLESVAREDPEGGLRPSTGRTRLFLTPGSRFHVTDALLTNFHLPRSTLVMLVSAFAGRERILGLYAEAVARGYRFFSYGDAMLLVR